MIDGLGDDLKLDQSLLNEFCQKTNLIVTDESDEQLYSANDFDLFKEMMKKKEFNSSTSGDGSFANEMWNFETDRS